MKGDIYENFLGGGRTIMGREMGKGDQKMCYKQVFNMS